MALVLLFWTLCTISTVQSAIVPCTEYNIYSITNYYYSSHKTYYGCGIFFTCSKYKSKLGSSTTYYTQLDCCDGYGGADCIPICSTPCGTNKECSLPLTCTCIEGWGGSNCLTPICSTPCGTNKKCSLPQTCTCIKGWKGYDCLTPICNPSCGTNMKCSSPNTCTCIDGWKENDCLTDINECVDNTDSCEEGCSNINGSYVCTCSADAVLAKDDTHCLGSVNNVIVNAETNSIQLTWSSPANFSDDGTFSGYNITCSNANDVIEKFVSLPLTTYTFLSLTPFTLYECCIIPQWTTNGIGPPVCIEQKTLEDAPDDSPRDVSVIAADSSSVLIQWLLPNIPNGIVTQYNVYVNYTNGSNITSYTVDGKYSTLSLLEGLQVFQLVGVSISATTGGGEGPMSLYVYNRSEETEPDQVHYLDIDIISNYSFNVSWHPPISLKGIIINYHLILRNLTKNHSGLLMNELILDSYDHHYLVEDLKPFIPYQIEIAAATKIGKGDVVVKTVFTVESVPSVAPKWSIIQRTSAVQVELEWTHLSLEESRGYITGYSIIYAESVYACSLTGDEITVITDNDHLQLNELNPRLEYCIRIAASTSNGEGIYSQWMLVQVYDAKTLFFFIDEIHNCESWIQQNSQTKLNDFSNEIVIAIQKSCQCPITSDYIYKRSFLKCSKGLAVLRLSIIQIKEINNNKLLAIIEEWVNNSPALTLDGLELSIGKFCKELNCDDDDSHTVITSSSGFNSSSSVFNSSNARYSLAPLTLTVSVAVPGILISAMILIIICIAFGMLKIKRKRARSGRFDINEPSSTSDNACYEGVTRIAGIEPMSGDIVSYDQVHQYDVFERCRKKESQSNANCNENKDKTCHPGDSTMPAAIIEKRARSEKIDLKINEPSPYYSNPCYQISKNHKYRGVTRIGNQQQ